MPVVGEPGDVREFEIHVSQDVLDDLRRRLTATRWPDESQAAGWELGSNLSYMRELAEYWATAYDWRTQERRINAFPHYKTNIDGIGVHFIHDHGDSTPGLPLLLLHGWPSSFWEFNRMLPMLTGTAGRARGISGVVVPSLPGYGFSFRPFQRRLGIVDCADLLTRLMRDVLGYERYAVGGGDWGAYVATRMAHTHPDAVAGLHLNMLPLRRDEGWPPSPTREERAYLEALSAWQHEEAGYSLLQGTRPQTPSYALMDSPVGLAAWLIEKFALWSDGDADPDRVFERDDLLTNVMLYWVTGAIGASFWPYVTRHHGEWTVNDLVAEDRRLPAPLHYIDFPHENIRPPRSVAERLFDVRRWTAPAAGGHFPALEKPEVLAESLLAFTAELTNTRA